MIHVATACTGHHCVLLYRLKSISFEAENEFSKQSTSDDDASVLSPVVVANGKYFSYVYIATVEIAMLW